MREHNVTHAIKAEALKQCSNGYHLLRVRVISDNTFKNIGVLQYSLMVYVQVYTVGK